VNLAIDLDGTLAEWDNQFVPYGQTKGTGGWLGGAREALEQLLEQGHRVVLHSCRATWEDGGGTEACEEFLRSGGFVPVRVVGQEMAEGPHVRDLAPHERQVGVWVGVGKPVAHWYVDDRAVEFRGQWSVTLSQLELLDTGEYVP
jgi:hypothetical protein